jgi:hypothetical protein
VPSWVLIGEQDHTIPAALQDFMADINPISENP